MADRSYDQLLDHEYDGIREYDNPCPAWWHLIFAGSAVFSVIYFGFFHLGNFGWSIHEAHQTAVADDLKLRFAEIGELPMDEPTVLEYMGKPDWLAIGSAVYQAQCKSCHGADGSGAVGPNLTDDHYKNVKQLGDVVRVVQEGAANGSMPAWRTRLHPNEIVLVSAYVANMRGQNLPGPRGAEGDQIAPWPEGSPSAKGDAPGEGDGPATEATTKAQAEVPAESESEAAAEQDE
jgi:cytochrome c oxidase cbb3-type subunit 3